MRSRSVGSISPPSWELAGCGSRCSSGNYSRNRCSRRTALSMCPLLRRLKPMADVVNDEAYQPEGPREPRDISFRVVAGFGIGLLVLLAATSVILAGLYVYLSTHDAKSDV